MDWLALSGRNRWPVLMKDARIRYRDAERAALATAHIHAFCLASGNLRSAEMAGLFIRHQEQIWLGATQDEPALWVVSQSAVRRVEI